MRSSSRLAGVCLMLVLGGCSTSSTQGQDQSPAAAATDVASTEPSAPASIPASSTPPPATESPAPSEPAPAGPDEIRLSRYFDGTLNIRSLVCKEYTESPQPTLQVQIKGTLDGEDLEIAVNDSNGMVGVGGGSFTSNLMFTTGNETAPGVTIAVRSPTAFDNVVADVLQGPPFETVGQITINGSVMCKTVEPFT